MSLPLWLSPRLSQQAQNSPSCQRASISAKLGAGLARPQARGSEWATRPQSRSLAAPSLHEGPAQVADGAGAGIQAPSQGAATPSQNPTQSPRTMTFSQTTLRGSGGDGWDGPYPCPLCLLTCLNRGIQGSAQARGSDSGARATRSHLPLRAQGRQDSCPAAFTLAGPQTGQGQRTGRRCQLEKAGPAPTLPPPLARQPSPASK